MELEFEIKPEYLGKHIIGYNVYRKGLKVGSLSLEEPYNEEKAICKEMILKWMK